MEIGMAANQMFLVNTRTGGKLPIAEWIVGVGWCFKDLSEAETGPDFDDCEDVQAGTDSGPWAIQLQRAAVSD
jgi:hypothetical protein